MKTIIRDTLANLYLVDPFNLDFNDIGIVTNDSTTTNNGVYRLGYNVASGAKSNDSNWVRTSVPRRTVLAADVANSANDTLADVTGLSFPILANKTYRFRAQIIYSAAATTTGSRWTVNTAATVTSLFYRSNYSLTTTSETVNSGLGAVQLPAAASATSAATTGNTAIIEGIIKCSTAGTLIVQSASEVNTSAVTAKALLSYLDWEEI